MRNWEELENVDWLYVSFKPNGFFESITFKINEEDYFNNYIKSKTSIINRILKISPNINIIKFENIANEEEALQVYLKNIKELNLFDVFECFLKGDFHKVIKDSIKLLVFRIDNFIV